MEVGGLRTASIIDRIDGPTGWTIERDVHVLILHEAGSYHYLETWLDGHRTSLGDPLPGEMWFIPAGRPYRGAAQGGAVRYLQVEIPTARLSVSRSTRAVAAYQDEVLADHVRTVHAGNAGSDEGLLAGLAQLLQAVTALPVAPAVAQRIDALMVFIQSRLEGQVTVQDMAEEAGMSVNSLIANFGRANGRTPAQYVLHQRLRRACWFLMNRPLSVAEIAFATGFSSHAHLCAAFRGKLGISPVAWRRQAMREGLL